MYLSVCIYVVQRRTIVAVLDEHRHDPDITSLISDLEGMNILSHMQSQKLASMEDEEKGHEALLYLLLAHSRQDTYHMLVESMRSRNSVIAADFEGVLEYRYQVK